MRDDVEAICREVRALSAAHDVVITAGGLGEPQSLMLCRLQAALHAWARVCQRFAGGAWAAHVVPSTGLDTPAWATLRLQALH